MSQPRNLRLTLRLRLAVDPEPEAFRSCQCIQEIYMRPPPAVAPRSSSVEEDVQPYLNLRCPASLEHCPATPWGTGISKDMQVASMIWAAPATF